MKNSRAGQRKRKASAAAGSGRASTKGPAPKTTVAITFRHVEPTDALRTYAERKFGRIARHLKRDCDAHLILAVDRHRQSGEVTLKSGKLEFAAREETNDLYSVIDLLADKAAKQLQNHLEKASTRRIRTASTGVILTAIEEG
jgi:putative sigma-54 modulation protein